MNPWIPVPPFDSLTINTSQWPKNSSTHAMNKNKNGTTMKTDYLMRFLFLCESSSSFLPSVVVRPGSASTTHQSRSACIQLCTCGQLLYYYYYPFTYVWPPWCVVPFFSAPLPPPPRHEEWEKSYYRTCPVQCSVGRSQQWEIAIYISAPGDGQTPQLLHIRHPVLDRSSWGESQGNPTNIIYCIVTDFY